MCCQQEFQLKSIGGNCLGSIDTFFCDLYNIVHNIPQTIGAKISGIIANNDCLINKILTLNIPRTNPKILASGTAAFSSIVFSNITGIT